MEDTSSAAIVNPGMACAVILCLSPHPESQTDKILQHVSTMPVEEAIAPLPIQPGHGCAIPTMNALSMDDGHLRLTALARPRRRYQFIPAPREHERNAKTIAIAVTGLDRAGSARSARATGFAACQGKPPGLEAPLSHMGRLVA